MMYVHGKYLIRCPKHYINCSINTFTDCYRFTDKIYRNRTGKALIKNKVYTGSVEMNLYKTEFNLFNTKCMPMLS